MAQVTPPPKFAATFVDANGFTKPAVGYKLYSYQAGTSTPQNTYTDYTLGTPNANPVVLDARGEASVWLSGNYKLVLKDAADSTVWTVDDVRDLASNQTLSGMTLAGALTVTSTAVTWSGNPTHSGNHTWSGTHLFNGNVTLGDASVDTLTIKPNVVTWTNNPTHSGTHTWSGAQTYNANPAGKIIGGTYTPTLSNVQNIDSSTAHTCFYMRVGDVVTVSGTVDVDPTAAAATQTLLSISLPIASDLTAFDLAGSGSDSQGAASSGNTHAAIYADAGANKAILSFYAGLATSRSWTFTFMYSVI